MKWVLCMGIATYSFTWDIGPRVREGEETG
jgi:hypothetical protein